MSDMLPYHRIISDKLAILKDRESTVTTLQANRDQKAESLQNVSDAYQLLRTFYEQTQSISVKRLEQLVSYCLRTVFSDQAYGFRIVFETKRNQVEARMVFLRDDAPVDPLEAAGGGCLDVAVCALRLAVILFHVKRPRRFIALDEPFRYVSQEYRANLIGLIHELSRQYGVQFFIITHDQDLIRLSSNPIIL
jgi:DNA repair exonuclease SbcCD ATPase subunit